MVIMSIRVETGDWQTAPKPLADDKVIFAIGDVHGHADHLSALHDYIRSRIATAYAPGDATVVWLGDYVDRGPQPRDTLDLVRKGLGGKKTTEIKLMGNHERFLLNVAEAERPSRAAVENWIWNGGEDTVRGLLSTTCAEDGAVLAANLRESLGKRRMAFLNSLDLQYRVDDYFFAHAGIDPARALDDQREADLIWIREPFLAGKAWPHDVVVVHGHTPGDPCVLPHRIGIDSGVFYSGILAAVEIAGERLRFFSAVSA